MTYSRLKTHLTTLLATYGTELFFGALESTLRDMHRQQENFGSHAELLRLAANSIGSTRQILMTETNEAR